MMSPNENPAQNIALILAAGRGQRAGAGLPKTYREIDGMSVLRRAVLAYFNHLAIDHIQVVIHPDDRDLYENAVEGLSLLPPALGGDTRAQSVSNGLKATEALNPNYVLIHDGARPFVSAALIDRVIEKLGDFDGVIPALPSTDALWKTDGERLIAPVNRENIIRAQTPQGFHYNKYAPIALHNPQALDDAQTAIAAGLNIAWVMGDAENVKLTFPEDFS